jgi:hypothetical protein
MSNLNVGDVVFIKPYEAEVEIMAVDPTKASELEMKIMDYDPTYEGKPIRLRIMDPNKNYVVWDVAKEEARLVDEEEAHNLNQTGYYMGLFLKNGELEWEDPFEKPLGKETWFGNPTSQVMSLEDREKDRERGDNPKYICPVVKDKVVFVDGHGSALLREIDENE